MKKQVLVTHIVHITEPVEVDDELADFVEQLEDIKEMADKDPSKYDEWLDTQYNPMLDDLSDYLEAHVKGEITSVSLNDEAKTLLWEC